MRPTFPEREFVEQIEDLLHLLDGSGTQNLIRYRVHELLVELFTHVPNLLEIDRLAEDEAERQSLNFAGLRTVVEVLAKAPRVPDLLAKYVAAENDPESHVQGTLSDLAELEQNRAWDGNTLNLHLFVSTMLAKRIWDLQIVSEPHGPHVDALRAEVDAAIALWTDEEVLAQVREAQAEFGDLPGSPAFDRACAPPGLLDARTVDQARRAIAEYIVRDKVRIVQDWIRRDGDGWPARAISVAQVVAYNTPRRRDRTDGVAHWAERGAFDAVVRVFALSAMVFSGSRDQAVIESALKLRRPLRSLRLINDRIAQHQKNTGANFLKLLLFESKTLARALGLLTQTTILENVLRSYKLRHEVMRDAVVEELPDTLHEERFQRHACAYLLDHAISSFGTKFARVETDLIIDYHLGDESFVIEAKVIRSKDRVSAAIYAIQQGFIQLKKYINDTPTARVEARRGILLVYCFAPVVVTYPHAWVRKRYRIVVVDLAQVPVSKRRKTLSIDEASVRGGSEILVYDSSPAKPKKSPSKKKTPGKKRVPTKTGKTGKTGTPHRR